MFSEGQRRDGTRDGGPRGGSHSFFHSLGLIDTPTTNHDSIKAEIDNKLAASISIRVLIFIAMLFATKIAMTATAAAASVVVVSGLIINEAFLFLN